jgi:hypothetical protein
MAKIGRKGKRGRKAKNGAGASFGKNWQMGSRRGNAQKLKPIKGD